MLAGFTPVEMYVLKAWMSERLSQLHIMANRSGYPDTLDSRQPPLPVFWSPDQGIGKTLLMDSVLLPFGRLCASFQVQDVTDRYSHKLWSQYLAVSLDEMAGASRACISTLKRWVYSKRTCGRNMHSETHSNLPKVTSFVGTCNERPATILKDDTGNRRFFGIRVTQSIIELILATDWLSVWRGIDPHYRPSESEREQIKRAQEKQARSPSVQEWIEEKGQELIATGKVDERAAMVVYDNFKQWFINCYNSKPLDRKQFTRQLEAAGFSKKKTDGRYVWCAPEMQKLPD